MAEYKNYLQENSKIRRYAADCQLVSAVNASYYLHGTIIKQNSKQYKELAEKAGCVHGSCINIKKVWKDLNIWEDERFPNKFELHDNLKEDCFIESTIWHQKYGFHVVSIIDYIEKADCLQVLNFKYVTTVRNWIFWDDFQHFLTTNPNKEGKYWIARTFKKNIKWD